MWGGAKGLREADRVGAVGRGPAGPAAAGWGDDEARCALPVRGAPRRPTTGRQAHRWTDAP